MVKERTTSLAAWYGRLRNIVLRSPEPASRSYRYMSRLIEQEFPAADGGICLGLSSPDNEKVSTDALLMLAYCLHSELDIRVLIVDARPRPVPGSITDRLGLGGQPGYAEALRDGFDPGKGLLRPTAVSNVDVMPAGASEIGNRAYTDRDRLTDLLNALRTNYDYILMQVGAITGDTRNLLTAAHADVVFLLAEENRTLLKSVDDCQRRLLDNGTKDVRIIIAGERT